MPSAFSALADRFGFGMVAAIRIALAVIGMEPVFRFWVRHMAGFGRAKGLRHGLAGRPLPSLIRPFATAGRDRGSVTCPCNRPGRPFARPAAPAFGPGVSRAGWALFMAFVPMVFRVALLDTVLRAGPDILVETSAALLVGTSAMKGSAK